LIISSAIENMRKLVNGGIGLFQEGSLEIPLKYNLHITFDLVTPHLEFLPLGKKMIIQECPLKHLIWGQNIRSNLNMKCPLIRSN
jgi:hypothetical protein